MTDDAVTQPTTVLVVSMMRSQRLLDVAQEFYRMERLDPRVLLSDLAPAARYRFIRAAEIGWQFIQFGEQK